MTTQTISSDHPSTSKEVWLRGLFMLLFGVLYSVAEFVLYCTALLQFLFLVITGKGNDNLASFGAGLGEFARDAARFMTMQSDEKPFPFKPWKAD